MVSPITLCPCAHHHRRDGRGIHPAAHGHRNCLLLCSIPDPSKLLCVLERSLPPCRPRRTQLPQLCHHLRNLLQHDTPLPLSVFCLPRLKRIDPRASSRAQPHRGQHVRRLNRPRGARRAGRNRDSLQVHRNHQAPRPRCPRKQYWRCSGTRAASPLLTRVRSTWPSMRAAPGGRA